MLITAFKMAEEAHKGQRYNDDPYIIHPMRVMIRVTNMGSTSEMQAAALLHDAMEDSDLSFGDIFDKFGNLVASLVMILTHDKERDLYVEYIKRCAASDEARRIKIADLLDNLTYMNTEHESLRSRYETALKILKEAKDA